MREQLENPENKSEIFFSRIESINKLSCKECVSLLLVWFQVFEVLYDVNSIVYVYFAVNPSLSLVSSLLPSLHCLNIIIVSY